MRPIILLLIIVGCFAPVTSIGQFSRYIVRLKHKGNSTYSLSNPTAFLIGTRFVILPKDVIYVTTAPLHRWNRLISDLLPTLTSVRTLDVATSG